MALTASPALIRHAIKRTQKRIGSLKEVYAHRMIGATEAECYHLAVELDDCMDHEYQLLAQLHRQYELAVADAMEEE